MVSIDNIKLILYKIDNFDNLVIGDMVRKSDSNIKWVVYNVSCVDYRSILKTPEICLKFLDRTLFLDRQMWILENWEIC